MKLELYPLKFEVSYNNKTYIIEAQDYYSGTDETKWLVRTDERKCLTKDYNLVDYCFSIEDVEKIKYINDNIGFDTKDEAVEALKIYLTIQNEIDKVSKVYNENIELLECKLEPIYKTEDSLLHWTDFLDLETITKELQKQCPFYVNKCSANRYGVQVTISEIRSIFLLEEAIKRIEKKYDCKVINYFGSAWTHFNYSPPLYYYFWSGGKEYVKHFAFIKNT